MSKANDIHKRDFYTTVADRFDTLANPFNQARRLEVIFDRLLSCDLQNQLVLDAGCGTGQIALQAQHRGARVIGIDISVAQLRQAKHKGLNNVTASDALHLPYPDALFDVVLSSEMIEHTIAPELAISEMARVLKPGGTLVLTCLNRAWKWLISLATSLKLRPFEGYENFPTFARLESFTRRSGLHINST